MKVIAGSSNLPLAQKIATELKLDLVEVSLTKFANDEKRISIKENLQGENVILVQSFSQPVDEHIIELLLLTDALERLGVRHINIVIPWFGYSLQDKVFHLGEALSAKVVANLVSNTFAKRVFLLDVHNTSTAGFFSVPTHHLSALPLFEKYARETFDLKNTVVASPDFGGLKRAWELAQSLEIDWVNIDKRRDLKTHKIVEMTLHGEVEGKDVLVFDDVVVSGNTVTEAAQILKKNGALSIHFLATHGLLVKDAIDRLQASNLDSIVITDSILHTNLPNKIKVITSANIFAQHLKTWVKN